MTKSNWNKTCLQLWWFSQDTNIVEYTNNSFITLKKWSNQRASMPFIHIILSLCKMRSFKHHFYSLHICYDEQKAIYLRINQSKLKTHFCAFVTLSRCWILPINRLPLQRPAFSCTRWRAKTISGMKNDSRGIKNWVRWVNGFLESIDDKA